MVIGRSARDAVNISFGDNESDETICEIEIQNAFVNLKHETCPVCEFIYISDYFEKKRVFFFKYTLQNETFNHRFRYCRNVTTVRLYHKNMFVKSREIMEFPSLFDFVEKQKKITSDIGTIDIRDMEGDIVLLYDRERNFVASDKTPPRLRSATL